MKKKINITFFFLSTFTWVIIDPDIVLATQTHGTPEGIYVHQMAHLFFILSMGFLSTG